MKRALLLVLVLGGLLLVAASVVVGADPSAAPTTIPADVLEGGDPRSGVGPGLVGNPLLILGAVVLLGVATAAVTVLVARLLQRD